MSNSLDFKIGVDNVQALAALRQMEAEITKTIVKMESARAGSGAGRTKELEAAYTSLAKIQGQISGLGLGPRLSAEFTGFLREVPVLGRLMNALLIGNCF